MQEKIKDYQQRLEGYADQLQDVRVIGLLTFAIIVLLVSWSGVKAIDTNYRLQKQITSLQQQNDVQELSNNNLKLQNEYYNSQQYLELEARQNFGLAMPGETELLVPTNIALAHTVKLANAEQEQATTTKAKQPGYQRNFQAWMNFFLHR